MGKINLGNNEVSAVYLGANEVLRMYLGNEIIYDRRALDISTQNLLDRATTLGYSTPSNIYALDDLIKGMKTIGIWDKLDIFYLFSSDLGSYAPFRLLNMINPDNHQATGYGGLEWTSKGVKGNGTNAYIDTNFQPYEGTRKYQQNNASRGVVITDTTTSTNATSNIIDALNYVFSNDYNSMFNISTTAGQKINGDGTAGIYDGLGFKLIARQNAEQHKQINRDSNNTYPSVSVFNSRTESQILLRRVINNSQAGYSQLGLGCYFMGEYIDNIISQQFRTIFNNYLTAIGQTAVA